MPPILHACRESRVEALLVYELSDDDSEGSLTGSPSDENIRHCMPLARGVMNRFYMYPKIDTFYVPRVVPRFGHLKLALGWGGWGNDFKMWRKVQKMAFYPLPSRDIDLYPFSALKEVTLMTRLDRD